MGINPARRLPLRLRKRAASLPREKVSNPRLFGVDIQSR
jgi:hypothetical protein